MAQDARTAGPGTASPTALPAAAAASGSAPFAFPHYHSYPPMFTLQPNLNTRRAQLDKWCSLVLAYCRHYRIFRLAVAPPSTAAAADAPGPRRVDGAEAAAAAAAAASAADADDDDTAAAAATYYAPDLFCNRTIDRAMPAAEVREVFEALRRQGRIEVIGASPGTSLTAAAAAPGDAFSCHVFWKTPEEWAAAVEAFVDDTAQRGSVLTLYELTAGDGTRGSELHGLDPVVLQRALAVLVKRGKAQVFGSAESLGVKFF